MRDFFVGMSFCAWFVCLWIIYPFAAKAELPPVATPFEVRAAESVDSALVIAAENYLVLGSIPGAIATANDWGAVFEKSLKVQRVDFLLNQNVTKENIQEAVEKAAIANKGGRLWIVYVGHGAPALDGKDGLLVGVDAQQSSKSIQARGVSQKDIFEILKKGNQRETIVILDACFSGRDAEGNTLTKGEQPVIPVLPTVVPKNTVVLSAAQADQVAGDLAGRPAFSYLLMGAMRGWASEKETVTVEKAIDFVNSHLRKIPTRNQTATFSKGSERTFLSRGVKEGAPHLNWLLGGGNDIDHGASKLPSEEPLKDSPLKLAEQKMKRRTLKPINLSAPETVKKRFLKLICSVEPKGNVCPVCPDGTDGEFVIANVATGLFSSPDYLDHIVEVDGCQPHVANFGMTFWLREDKVVKMESGRDLTGDGEGIGCFGINQKDGTQSLLCNSTHFGQGAREDYFFVRDFRKPKYSNELFHFTGTPGMEHEVVYDFVYPEISVSSSEDGSDVTLLITVEKKSQVLVDEETFQRVDGAIERFKLEFNRIGEEWQPTPESKVLIKKFGDFL